MTINALPTPPSRADSPEDFSGKADALLGALPQFVAEANALQAAVNADEASASAAAATATAKADIATTKAGEASADAAAADAARINAESARNLAAGYSDAAGQSAAQAAASALSASNDAATCAALVAGIADGPVTSVNGQTGIVALTPADIGVQTVYLAGDTAPYVTQTKTYTITNYNSFSEYVVQASAGSVSLSGDTITFIAPAAPGTVTLTVIVDGAAQLFAVTVQPAAVATPVIASPIQGATGITETPTITTSAFAAIGASDTHLNTDWEIRTAANGAGTLVASNAASATDKTSWTVSAGLLSVSTTYYVRARHRGTTLGVSAWGESSFTTADSFNSYIATPSATPANFGDAFEGGFYGGLYWDQIAQSSSSKTLASGTQSFTVPDMTGAPIVYAGQTIEVRSRANPANKFIGTVTGASGTTLTLNVTSIGGSGTFSDWSVMSRFRAIFAPKSSGEHAGIALKNAATALPTGCQSLVDGWTATEAMKNAGTSTVYPAAHWARSLNIGGRTDWQIPARDVLELAWRNLKPATSSNYVTADRPTAQTFDYKRDGAYGDTANTHGTNNNSSPTGSAYTASVPAQTAATVFRTGGSEAFEFGSAYYWSSTEYSASNAWIQYWTSSYPGYQYYDSKTNTSRVRAVRRSII